MAPGQYISLCVSDTGSGMTPQVQAKAFDPFFTTKPIGVGTGMGLSMIYGFAKQSDGAVSLYSEEGQGAMVCIYLPRHLGQSEVAEVPLESSDAPRGEGKTVLVIDDTPDAGAQADLFATADPRAPDLLAAIDGLNSRFGRDTITLAVQGRGPRGFDTKRSQKSPAWTTRIDEIPTAR